MIEVMARLEPWNGGISVALRKVADNRWVVADPLVWREVEEGMAIEPTMRLPTEVAQKFMDELWGCGLRPSEGTGSAGALAATQKHLEDMRTLVFQRKGE